MSFNALKSATALLKLIIIHGPGANEIQFLSKLWLTTKLKLVDKIYAWFCAGIFSTHIICMDTV